KLGRAEVPRRRAEGLHAVGRLEGVAQPGALRPGSRPTAAQGHANGSVVAAPEKRADALERGARGEGFDVVAGDDQTPTFSVDVAETRVSDDDSLEAGRLCIRRGRCRGVHAG